ncbi:MAG: redoxin domain-containing protein [Cyanobacteria bacterium J06649_4]
MPKSDRLMPGAPFPAITLATADGAEIKLNAPGWRAIFVIRGAHCGICRNLLKQLETWRSGWQAKGIDVVVASADPVSKSRPFMEETGFAGTAACGLDIPTMEMLGLWMTGPDTSGLDYVHPEPGFFLVDPESKIAAIDITTLPAIRPDLNQLNNGFTYIIEKDIRPPFGKYEVMS